LTLAVAEIKAAVVKSVGRGTTLPPLRSNLVSNDSACKVLLKTNPRFARRERYGRTDGVLIIDYSSLTRRSR
jgi:hypothetical protein